MLTTCATALAPSVTAGSTSDSLQMPGDLVRLELPELATPELVGNGPSRLHGGQQQRQLLEGRVPHRVRGTQRQDGRVLGGERVVLVARWELHLPPDR